MTLSLELIAETMADYGAEILLAREQSFCFRQVKILSLEDLPNLAEDVLYISQPKALRKLSRSVFRNHCFVFSAGSAAVERYRDLLNAIVFDEATPLGTVINHLLELFQRTSSLEMQMQLAVRGVASYEPMMNVARQMFPNCLLIVVDSAYNIIASTHDSMPSNADIDHLLRQGYYDKQYLQRMVAYGYFDNGDRFLTPRVSQEPNVAGFPMLIRSFHNTGLFYSFVVCYFMDGMAPTLLDQNYFAVFTDQLNQYFRDSGFYENSIPKKQQMLEDLLSGEKLTVELVQERCRELRLPASGEFRLGYVEYRHGSPIKLDHMANQLRNWCQVKNYGVFLYRDSLVILFKDWHGYDLAENSTFVDRWKDMLETLGSGGAQIGVSLLFTSMLDIRSAFLQARSALELGNRMHPDRQEYHYSRYFVYDLLDSYRSRIPLETLYTQYLDQLSPEPGSSASNLHLLYHYINCERNISATAPKVHMHRNSVIYRLQKIHDLLRMDLDDPDVRLRLQLSFKILEMLGRTDFSRDDFGGQCADADFERGILPE
ncbi:MAG: helix-turn-helix domain-containing protein [Oscillospiraceae bacterium]|nr:helix-turn-helix domain-containing protein [Oscillospiraceae bacterium]